MEDKDIKPIKIKTKIQLTDYIYLGVIILFFVIIIILFFSSTNFFLKNINKIFTPNTSVDSNALNISQYSLLEKKLNLPINDINESLEVPIPVEEIVGTVAAPEILTTPKELLTISIINSTSKAGAAGALSKILTESDYPEAKTGSQKTIEPITSISLKETSQEYTENIADLVKKNYKNVEIKALGLESEFDIIIIIGK